MCTRIELRIFALHLGLVACAVAQFSEGQKVRMLAPSGFDEWTVPDDCSTAGMLMANPRNNWAIATMNRDLGLAYTPGSVATIQEVDADGECVWVEIHPEGPSGWVDNKAVELTREEQQRLAVRAKSAKAKSDAAALAVKQAKEVAERVDPAKPLQLLEHSGGYTEFATTVTGRVRNNTDRRFRYVQITFALYDTAGNQVGTALANIAGLEPGAIWKFKAVGLTPATRFKLSELEGR